MRLNILKCKRSVNVKKILYTKKLPQRYWSFFHNIDVTLSVYPDIQPKRYTRYSDVP
jgi:hypothetical protein